MRAIFAFAVEQKYIHADGNPTLKTKIAQNKKMVRFLSKQEREKLFACLTDTARAFFMFLSFTGMRYSEVVNLKWDDVKGYASMAYLEDAKTSKVRGEYQPRFLSAKALALIEKQPRISDYVFCNP